MKLAVSNLAWNYNESHETFEFLKGININNIELVLTKYKSWEELNAWEIFKYKNILDHLNMFPCSIQSLFYNINCTIEDEQIVINHFKRLIDYSKILGSNILVFGSPSLRKKINNFEYKISKIFKEVDEYLIDKEITIVIEPNTVSYGGEYFTNVSEIVNFIKKNNLINIKTMIDTHNILLEKMDPTIDIDRYFDYIYHIHISEPQLAIIRNESFHLKFSEKLKETEYNKIITYEVNKCDELKESIKLFSEIYR
jgi:sugar phosphate isomerase/epimerase